MRNQFADTTLNSANVKSKMPGKVYSSNSYSSEESSSSSSCKREWLTEKRPLPGNDDQTDFKHQSGSSGSFPFSSSPNRKHSREQRSQSPVSRYSSGHGPSYKENGESKGRKRWRSYRSSRSSSPEASGKRRYSNTYSREDSRSQNPKNSRQSSYSSNPSHSRSDKRTEFNSYSKAHNKVHSVISRPSMRYEEKWRFSSKSSESRYNRTGYRNSRPGEQPSNRKYTMNSSPPGSSRNRRRSYVASSITGSSDIRERSVSSGSGETNKVKKSSSSSSTPEQSDTSPHSRSSGRRFRTDPNPIGKQRRRPSSSSDISHVSTDHSQASLECQCEQDLGINGQGTRYGSTNDYSSSPLEDHRVKRNISYRTPTTPLQHSKTVLSSPSHEAWATQFVARSKTYRYNFIDSHCHIDFLYNRMGVSFNTPYSEFMRNHAHSYPDNYEGCVAVFCNPRTFNLHRPQDAILNMVSRESGVWLALGCHPKSATEFGVSHEQGLRKMLSHPKVVALGEIGLDYSGRFGLHAEVQKRVLITQLKLALELNLPLVIHCRDADVDCLYIMKQYVPRHHKIHLHCFSRDPTTAQHWMNAFPNLYLGFTPVLTYSSAWEPALSSQLVPLDRLLLETDAPYFVPGQIKKTSVKFSHPGLALFTAEKIAELRGISVDQVLKACRENTRNMYGI